MHRYFAMLVIISLWLNFSCEETENTMGGIPGGNPQGVWDSLSVNAMSIFNADHSLLNARKQYVGYVDSLGLEAQFLFQVDYVPYQLLDPLPEEDSFKATLALKMDNIPENLIMENHGAAPPDLPGESANYMQLELLMLDLDTLDWGVFNWETIYNDGVLAPAILDSVSFYISASDSVFGDSNDPSSSLARKTYRLLPEEWFVDSLFSSRIFLMRPVIGEQGMIPFLSSGYDAAVTPGIRFSWIDIDTVLTVPDSSWDTTYVPTTFDAGIVNQLAESENFRLLSGYSTRISLQLPPFPPEDSDYNPLTDGLSQAYLRLPIIGQSYNSADSRLHLYHVDADSPDSLDTSSLDYRYVTLSDSSEAVEFNMVTLLNRIWTESDTLIAEDPINFVLQFSKYINLELRMLDLASNLDSEEQPMLKFKIMSAPAEWSE
jgi:hypothetical protein